MATLKINSAGKLLITSGGQLSIGCPPSGCAECTSSTPTTVRVSLSGWADSTCTDCDEDVNGTYDLAHDGGTSCQWSIGPIATPVCSGEGDNPVFIDVTLLSTLVRVEVTYGTGSGSVCTAGRDTFESSATGYDDCANWSSFSVSHVSQTGNCCDGSGGTVTITAL